MRACPLQCLRHRIPRMLRTRTARQGHWSRSKDSGCAGPQAARLSRPPDAGGAPKPSGMADGRGRAGAPRQVVERSRAAACRRSDRHQPQGRPCRQAERRQAAVGFHLLPRSSRGSPRPTLQCETQPSDTSCYRTPRPAGELIIHRSWVRVQPAHVTLSAQEFEILLTRGDGCPGKRGELAVGPASQSRRVVTSDCRSASLP
jgi:hypothetical protein